MSSNEIKKVIASLCKLISKLYKIHLKPEHFRLAKFDRTEEDVVPKLWQLLSLVVGTNVEADIKKWLKSNNYPRNHFYQISENQNHGSRELLLAVAFAMAINLRVRIIEEVENSPFGKNNFKFLDWHNEHISPRQMSTPETADTQKFLKWLDDKTEQNKNLFSEYSAQNRRLLKKINCPFATRDSTTYTAYEKLAMTSKKYAKPFVRDAEYILELMNIYTDWLKKEKIFWKWMATAVTSTQ